MEILLNHSEVSIPNFKRIDTYFCEKCCEVKEVTTKDEYGNYYRGDISSLPYWWYREMCKMQECDRCGVQIYSDIFHCVVCGNTVCEDCVKVDLDICADCTD